MCCASFFLSLRKKKHLTCNNPPDNSPALGVDPVHRPRHRRSARRRACKGMVARAGRRRVREGIVAQAGRRGVREGARRRGHEDGRPSRKMESTREDCRVSRGRGVRKGARRRGCEGMVTRAGRWRAREGIVARPGRRRGNIQYNMRGEEGKRTEEKGCHDIARA